MGRTSINLPSDLLADLRSEARAAGARSLPFYLETILFGGRGSRRRQDFADGIRRKAIDDALNRRPR